MKTNILFLSVVCALPAFLTGCGSLGGSAYHHQMQGVVERVSGTNAPEVIKYNESQKGKGPRPKGYSPHGTPSVPVPATGSQDPFMPPSIPPISSAVDPQTVPQVAQTQVAQANPEQPGRLSLKRGMASLKASPGFPVGASVLPPKPLRDVSVYTGVRWNGGLAYDASHSRGSRVNATVWNGQLAGFSTQAWNNNSVSVQTVPNYLPYPGSYSYGQPSNYYVTGTGGTSYYPPSQLGPQPGNPTNYY